MAAKLTNGGGFLKQEGSMAHKCPASRCMVQCPGHLLMCRAHWFMVPQRVRQQVLDAWKALEAAKSGSVRPEYQDRLAAYQLVRERAVREVNARMGAFA